MTEAEYIALADQAFARIMSAFDEVDAEQADVESAGDVITITFGNGRRVVVNTQRPAKQIWLAGGQRAWHFGWDEASARWTDAKGSGAELFETLRSIARETGALSLEL